MRAGLTASVVLHAALLSWGLISLGQPEQFSVQDVEALPVEIVDLAELTQVQQGSETAPKDGPAAPEPTEPPIPVPDARVIGNQQQDQETPATEEQAPAPVEEAKLPTPSDVPVPTPAPREEPKPVVEPAPPEPPSTPATEVAPTPAPRQEVTPDPVPEAPEAAEPAPAPEEKFVELPEKMPTLASRPERPQAQTAKTPDRENKTTEQATAAPRNNEQDTSEDEVAALINREKGSGGGAAASNQKASAGGTKTTGGSTLTQSEMDSLRGQIQSCWSIPASAQGETGVAVSVQFRLTQAGQLDGRPKVTKASGNRQLDESAVRAIQRCGQNGYRMPREKYDAWQDVVVNFDPSEMFR